LTSSVQITGLSHPKEGSSTEAATVMASRRTGREPSARRMRAGTSLSRVARHQGHGNALPMHNSRGIRNRAGRRGQIDELVGGSRPASSWRELLDSARSRKRTELERKPPV
jgi:hypothetical protein